MATFIKANGEETNVLPKNKTDFKLDELQNYVGGFIEIVRTKGNKMMIINEEGKINELPVNYKATEMYQYDEFDFIAGDVLICNENEIL
jgi:Domain of unknown function (DUF3846)